ncbi:MAG: hypothetical protein RIR96_1315 [Bacteroidota bacterium]|jgi:endonuclease G
MIRPSANIKYGFVFLCFGISLFFSSCTKDSVLVETTASVDPLVIVPPVAPPTVATDSTLLLGNPSNASNNTADIGNYLLREGYYSVSYNRDRGIANWVSWHTAATDYGPVSRQDDFRANPNLPSGWYQVSNVSYGSSGFDRGHLCPSADRTSSIAANSSTFLMTNIIPQAPTNNQGVWARLEDYCRTLVTGGSELYIIAGAYGEGGSTTAGGVQNTLDNGRVTVPSTLWKVIVVLPNGSNDLNRVGNATRVISVVMPNQDGLSVDWRMYRNSVDFIEQETGLNLLSNLSNSIQNIIEARVDTL